MRSGARNLRDMSKKLVTRPLEATFVTYFPKFISLKVHFQICS